MPKYRDADWLREQYHGEGRSTTDMADECGVSDSTIVRWMQRHDIPRRDRSVALAMAWGYTANIHLYANGYDYLKHSERDTTHQIKHARLLGVAWFDLDPFGDWIVHHENGITWDDREENMTIMESQSDHAKHHSTERERDSRGRYA